jgi:hypothetical protein|tara:strand:- start:251 stop:586 length:336 start_codon:yes stop_codon:yes gene_type:complete
LSWLCEVKSSDGGGVEEDIPHTIGGGRSEGNWVAPERIAHFESTALEGDFALILDSTYKVARAVLGGLEGLRERLVADVISSCRSLHAQSFVGTLQVIDRPPVVESGLALR